MGKLKIYLETTIFNRYFEPERDNHNDTVRLFEEILEGNFEAFTSAYVIDELLAAAEPKSGDMISLVKTYNIKVLGKSEEVQRLAKAYVKFEMLSETHWYDRLHIACASVNGMDAIVSLNFKHINRFKTKTMTEPINILNGYGGIVICGPMEVI
ncbi:MAG: PIN domain-containing protein [Oscillospiraceae bacterium]|jgi:predicted nucleic acid-binding protein|nr:PIN domain-containing protein [Oscillospiraceae bacterium]